jgi:NitT/TauT family transport system substrate-binding protein
MKHRYQLLGLGAVVLPLLGVSAPAVATTEAPASECETVDEVSLQLQWFIQAQFSGFFAADYEGIYDKYCLDVEIIEGGLDIVPQQVLADGGADFATTWVPKALQTREGGADIVHIAQIFQRSGTLTVSLADSGITSPADLEGRTSSNWGFGNEYEIFAGLAQAGVDPAAVTHVAQGGDMIPLIEGQVDAAEAMTYNELALVLETVNPATGELFTTDDLNIISYEDLGVGLLQDSIWTVGERLQDEAFADVATRFVAASIEGWAFCRDNAETCAQYAIDAGSLAPYGHQLWMMNEINKLIWPADEGIGLVPQETWDHTVEISMNTPNADGLTFISAEPDEGARTTEIVEAAHALLGDSVDLTGADWTPIEVTPSEGGA